MDEHSKNFPRITQEARPYWEGCRRNKLLIQRCLDCGQHQFYPRIYCTRCMGDRIEWIETQGKGHVISYTVVRRAISPAYAGDVPYIVALIQLEEGPTMMSNIIDCEPEGAAVGMQVEVVFEKWSDEISVPKFRPATG